MRVWDAALTQEDIAGNYNRLLAGNEDNLQAYWRFNESVVSEFYDLSYLGTKYNENHGKIHDAQLDGDVVPEPEQLSFRGVTDKSGNYRIIGIPYSGDGYRIYIDTLLRDAPVLSGRKNHCNRSVFIDVQYRLYRSVFF